MNGSRTHPETMSRFGASRGSLGFLLAAQRKLSGLRTHEWL